MFKVIFWDDSLTWRLFPTVVIHYPRGGHPYKSGGDARRLALGSKLQILVFLRACGMEGALYLHIQVSLSTVHKEIYKKCPDTDYTEISLGGQLKLEPHLHWSPLGVNFYFRPSIPVTFMWGSPRDIIPLTPTVNDGSLVRWC